MLVTGVVGMALGLQLRAAQLAAQVEELEARGPEVEYVTEYVEVPVYVGEVHECGMCGAHTFEYWTAVSDDMSGTFECCRDCWEWLNEQPWGEGSEE